MYAWKGYCSLVSRVGQSLVGWAALTSTSDIVEGQVVSRNWNRSIIFVPKVFVKQPQKQKHLRRSTFEVLMLQSDSPAQTAWKHWIACDLRHRAFELVHIGLALHIVRHPIDREMLAESRMTSR